MSYKLSIIIVSYNTRTLLKNCLQSLVKVKDELAFEVFVVDNGSKDDSAQVAKKFIPKKLGGKIIKSGKNLGFAKGNNKAKDFVKTEYVLFLNSDTEVSQNVLKESVKYLEKNTEIGALTCKIVLPDGTLDKDTRRSFPTPWVALTHLVLKLDRVFPRSKAFSQYWYGYKSENESHEVDVLQGAYFLTRKVILDKVGWFDEDYFLDGEDIDLCWKIKETGKTILYYPRVSIKHIKKASKSNPQNYKERLRFISSGVDSMEMFYRKRLWSKYPIAINYLVVVGIRIVKLLRLIKIRARYI